MPRSKRKAYDRAIFLKPTIQKDAKFKLMFLRAEHYDAKKSAFIMTRYFDEKQELFGVYKVAKKITLGDFSEKDLEVYKTGLGVLLPHKDQTVQTGRPIWFWDATKLDLYGLDSMVSIRFRVCFFASSSSTFNHNILFYFALDPSAALFLVHDHGDTRRRSSTVKRHMRYFLCSGEPCHDGSG
jgi:hypothetical protein